MIYYCLKYNKDTESKYPNVWNTNKGKLIFLSKCLVCDVKNGDLLKRKKPKSY